MTFDTSKMQAHLMRVAAEFEERTAQAGWFPSATYEDGTPVAYVATIQEYGSPEVGIPPRQFMEPAKVENLDEWIDLLKKGVQAVAAGRRTGEQVLEAIGGKMVGDIQFQIETGDHQKLSDITVLLRKWRAQGRKITGATVGEAARALRDGTDNINGVNADPLRDTGLLVATVSHAVAFGGDDE